MQNFTFGRRGTNWFLFAFIMLIGTLPSFGQDCPSLDNPNPADFCYLDDIDDLTDATNPSIDEGTVRWYRSATSTNPIPANELLENNTTYYAGDENGDCTGDDRVAVTVTVEATDAPVSSYGNTFAPCIATDEDTHQVSQLLSGITPEGNLVVFTTEYGMDTYAEDDDLVAGQTYFVGQDIDGECPSYRIAIRYSPDMTEAPNATAEQTFCEGATISDLQASGTSSNTTGFRWYSTETSNPALDPSTTLVDGETYWVSQIINDEGIDTPPCESVERTAVTVELTATDFTDETQRFCESIGEGNDFRQPEVQDLSPAGDWFVDATSTEPLDPNTELIDGAVYFNRDTGNECSQLRVTVEFFPTPNAGSTTQVSFCENEDAVNLVDYIQDSQLGAPDQTGSFSPALSTGTNIFDPSEYEPGTYNFDYIVEGNDDCPTDEARVTVTVLEAPNAGDDVDVSICSSELENTNDLIAEFSSYLDGRDQGGTFDDLDTQEEENWDLNELGTNLLLRNEADPFQTYSFAYNVENDSDCEDSATIELTVLESPDAGESVTINLTEEDTDVLDLFEELGGTPESGGTWSNEDGEFDPSNDEPGTFTYTVTSNNGCEASATVTVNIIVDCPEVTAEIQRFCESIGEGNDFDRPRVSNLESNLDTPVWYADEDLTQELDSEELLVDKENYYASEDGTCPAEIVTVEFFDTPNAGSTTQVTFCQDEDAVNLVDYINDSQLGPPQQTGTFTPNLEGNIFDPSDYEPGTYNFDYIVEGSEECPTDEARITVTVEAGDEANAGDGAELEFCSNDEDQDLFSFLSEDANTEGSFEGYEDGIFSPSDEGAGTYEIEYTVNEDATCVVDGSEDTAVFTITVFEAPNAGDDLALEFCITEIEAMTEAEVMAIFASLAEGRAEGGEFSEDPMDLYADFLLNPIDSFETTYTIENENCSDSAELSVTITDAEEAYAGSDAEVTFCSTDEPQDLYSLLSEDAITTGEFEGVENGIFDPAAANLGETIITYTVNEENSCVTDEDSATITITVLEGPDAGEDASVEFDRTDDPVNLFDYLGGTPEEGGSWTPGNEDGSFDPSTGAAGNYTYTIANEDCEDSATISVSFTDEPIVECPEVTETEQAFCESIGTGNDFRRPRVSDLLPTNAVWYASADAEVALADDTVLVDGETYFAGNINGTCEDRDSVTVILDDSPNAGATTSYEICRNGEAFDIVEVLNESILGAADAGGTISPALESGTTIFDPAVDAAGRYTYTVSSTNEVCPDDEAVITISFIDADNAGDDMDLAVCTNSGSQNLFDFLSAEASTTGEFTLNDETIVDGIMDPADFEPGSYEITYFVESDDVCGDDSSTLTVTVNEVPDAPAAPELDAFCAIEMATGADLPMADGQTWYADAELTTMVAAEDMLEDGSYYLTVTSENGCESEATEVIVTINDSDAPTISSTNLEFCDADNPTIADLNAEIVESGEVTWYDSEDGTNALGTSTSLTSGTYYATLTGETGCESSQRLTVTVSVENCPILYPEAITPNGDGRNDTFIIENITNEYPNYSIEIFNRWGNVIYKGNASTPAWDGTSNQSGSFGDDVLPVGVYFYVIDFNDGSTEPKQGKVYLSR